MLSVPRALQTPGNTGIVPPYILDKLPKAGAPGNGGVVPPHLQPQPTDGNTGIVPPWLRPEAGVPGNTGIVPPYLRDRIEQSKQTAPGAPALTAPAGGHVATQREPFSTTEIAPGAFGRCPPSSAEELARSPAGQQAISAWFEAAVARANEGENAGSYDFEFFAEDNAWQFNFQGTGTWYQFDGNTLRIADTEGERTVAVEGPLTLENLLSTLARA